VTTALVALRAPAERFGAALRDVWTAGEAVLPLPSDATAAEAGRTLAAFRPDVLLTIDEDGTTSRRALPDPLPTDDGTALVVTTSGSTGVPKGVMHTRASLEAATTASLARLGCRPGDRWVLALPVHHIAGVMVVLRAWALGDDPIVVAPGDPVRIGGAPREARTHLAVVPTQLGRLLAAGVDLGRFASILLGGAAVEPTLLARARDAGGLVVSSYGMSETAGGVVYDGVPLDGVEVALDPDGAIRLRGPMLFAGYRPTATAVTGGGAGTGGPPAGLDADGWFTTPDRGRWVTDPTGRRLVVLGRRDDVIVSGGENVPANAVAATLRTLRSVADAAVTGRPDPDWGEVVVAVVVPADRAAPPTLGELRAHVAAHHPAAFAPRDLVVVDALPRDAMGKLSRERLLALL
jgi:o-succinylbenzoate---CoA ligase